MHLKLIIVNIQTRQTYVSTRKNQTQTSLDLNAFINGLTHFAIYNFTCIVNRYISDLKNKLKID